MALYRVYWIVNDTTDNVYVGRTELELRNRFALHLIDYYNWKRGKNIRHICRSCDVIECPTARIEVLESNIDSIGTSKIRERWWYDKKKEEGFTLTNRCRPTASDEEKKESKRQSERRNPRTDEQKARKKITDKIRHSSEEYKQKNKEHSARKKQAAKQSTDTEESHEVTIPTTQN